MRSRVLKAGEIGEREIGQAPVEWILRDSGDSQLAGNVVAESVKILGAGAAAVEVDADDVGQLADAARVGDRNIKAAHRSVAADAWKRIGQGGAGSVVVKAKGEIVARSIAATATASAHRGLRQSCDSRECSDRRCRCWRKSRSGSSDNLPGKFGNGIYCSRACAVGLICGIVLLAKGYWSRD